MKMILVIYLKPIFDYKCLLSMFFKIKTKIVIFFRILFFFWKRNLRIIINHLKTIYLEKQNKIYFKN
jgi:hypothetical protein